MTTTYSRKYCLIIRIPCFYMHTNSRTWRHKTASLRIIQLHFIIDCKFIILHISNLLHFLCLKCSTLKCFPTYYTPITVVSSGISSIKHFLSVSAMWKYNPEHNGSNSTIYPVKILINFSMLKTVSTKPKTNTTDTRHSQEMKSQ